MSYEPTNSWIRVGAFAGLLATLLYPTLLLAPLGLIPAVALACAFGILLGLASVGLYHFVALHRKTVTLQIAVVANLLAGLVFNLMIVVQLALRSGARGLIDAAGAESPRGDLLRNAWRVADKVQLGMDVVWDVYIALGTFLFAWNLRHHPRFGRLFGWSGMAIATALLALNLWTFPEPPATSDLLDLGPLLGIWYLAVAIQVIRSFGWAQRQTGA